MERRGMGSVERLFGNLNASKGKVHDKRLSDCSLPDGNCVWPVTLTLIGISAGVALYTKRRVLGVALVVLFMLVAITAWQFERYM